jgi:LysR family transcriptional activator of nhaA
MEWVNYQHLLYFWTVVRAGGISKASDELRLTPPTISAQLRTLEDSLGEKLLIRSGRNLKPTEMGHLVYQYADEIFSLGRELLGAVKQRPSGRPARLVVGIDDVLPKEIAYRLIKPALSLRTPVRILCREASLERLVADLAVHELDVVLSDAPATPSLNIRAYNHLLGDCGITFVGTPKVVGLCKGKFPRSLHGAPVLLPTNDTAIRRNLDQWFDAVGIRPVVVGEFEDYALLRVFGAGGTGIFPVPSVLDDQFRRNFGMRRIGEVQSVRSSFYAISIERRVNHPAVAAICETARRKLFS